MKTGKVLFLLMVIGLALASCSSAGKISGSSGSGDGSSIENAVVINSMRAEYLWIDRAYPGSDLLSQVVIQRSDRYYDVVTIRTSDGVEKDVYFDISQFHKPKTYDIDSTVE